MSGITAVEGTLVGGVLTFISGVYVAYLGYKAKKEAAREQEEASKRAEVGEQVKMLIESRNAERAEDRDFWSGEREAIKKERESFYLERDKFDKERSEFYKTKTELERSIYELTAEIEKMKIENTELRLNVERDKIRLASMDSKVKKLSKEAKEADSKFRHVTKVIAEHASHDSGQSILKALELSLEEISDLEGIKEGDVS